MSPQIEIRPETPADRAVIRTIVERAFGQSTEADLVEALREDGDLLLSLVAVSEEPVGHIAFSRLILPGSTVRASALAPLAVIPARQRQGVGAALVQEGLLRLSRSGEDLVIVLGEPGYYGRLGFSAATAGGLRTPYDGPSLQALALTEAGRAAHGPVRYSRAFAGLA
jgi:putative acetyltransferase